LKTQHLPTALIVALLVLSHGSLLADSIAEIVAKSKLAILEIVAMDATGTPTKLGTGFFVSPDGLAVTNFHVIDGATSLVATRSDGVNFPFQRIVSHPPGVDLVVLQLKADGVPFLSLGESTDKVEGEKIIVIGNPKGLTGRVSDGIISAFRENHSYIQITAPIAPGSSGSPVLDEIGNVIGVASLMSVEGHNLNFAIPVEEVSAALTSSIPQIAIPVRVLCCRTSNKHRRRRNGAVPPVDWRELSPPALSTTGDYRQLSARLPARLIYRGVQLFGAPAT
jgi:S1-C subfamily serine protease